MKYLATLLFIAVLYMVTTTEPTKQTIYPEPYLGYAVLREPNASDKIVYGKVTKDSLRGLAKQQYDVYLRSTPRFLRRKQSTYG